MLLGWNRFLFFKSFLIKLSFLLNCCQEGVGIKINLLAKRVVLIFDLLQTLFLCIILFLNKLANFFLFIFVYILFLRIEHQNCFLMLLRIILLQTLHRFIDISYFLFVFAFNLSLLHNFIFSLLFDELIDGHLLLLLETFKLNFAIIKNFLYFRV